MGLAALHQAGCAVTVVGEGRLALEAWRNQEFEVVILERDLPGLSGEEVLCHLRQEGWTGPVHILTSAASLPAALACGRLGATTFQEKPPQPEQLAACLLELVGSGADLPADPAVHLTPQEKRVLYLLHWGLSSAEMAQRLEVEETTVRWYVRRILEKLGITRRAGAVGFSFRKKVL